jgi:threonine dehydrogenase-like Zn-dependent dehydrogenase
VCYCPSEISEEEAVLLEPLGGAIRIDLASIKIGNSVAILGLVDCLLILQLAKLLA